jgi:superfamily I DNA/RNA helicase/DNA-binding MarR family transcriptional regulator
MIYISENDLADYTGIDPTTIRIAIYQLEKNGYVKRGVNAWKIITLRLSSIPTKLTEDQKKLLISLKLNESNWKTIQIDILASKLQWTIEKTENEIRGLLHCGPPILQEQKSIQVKILSRHTKTDLNIKYDLQKMLLTYLIKRSSSFEAGRWTSIYPKDWGLCGQALSKQLNLELNIDFPEIIQLWQKDYLVSIYEELLKISIKLNTGPEKIYCYFKNNKEIDLLVFQRLLNLCKETDIISFDPQEISEAIGISESELKNSLLRLNIFKIITTESVKSKGNCYTLNLLTPLSDSLSPNEIILKPKDLDLEDLRKLRLDRENKIKNIKKYAEIQDSFIERWKFLIDYFEGKMEIEQSEVFKEIVKGLNERQTDVVISPSKYLLVNAGAGTGKTETVARRLLFITDMRGIPSSRLLALTFSKSGVLQLRFRIRKIMPDRKVDIRTYHSLAFQILSEHAGKSPLWIKPGFRVRAISGLIHEFRSQIEGFNDNLKKEDKILKYQYAIEKLQSERTCIFPEDIKDTDVLKIEDCEVQGKFLKKLYAAYLNYLKSHNLIDFGFMLAQTVYLFNSQPNILTHYQKKLNYIIVDEYQDTTPVQDELLRLLSDWYGELTVVGDNDQNIFAWNFADVKNILDFEKTYPGSKVINLERNYRSTKRILEIANASINHNKLRIPKTLFPDRVSIGSFVKIKYTDSNDDIGIDYIVGRIREIQELNMCNLHEIAILTRSNKQQTTIIEALRDVNIPASSPKEEIELFNNIQIKEIIDMMEIISKEKPDITAYNCFTEALHALQKQNTFSKFVDAIKEFEDSSEDNSASAFVRYTRSVSKSDFRFGNEEAVNVLTIHKSKGLEFKVVFVTYLSKFKFPIFKSDIEEERRVFYVSLTRAENELHVIGSKEQKSIFIEEIEHLLQNADNINFQPKKLDEIPSELRYQL